MAWKPASQYKRYEKEGISLLLPTFLHVRSHIPHFFADSDRPPATVAIEISSNQTLRSSSERLLRGPLGLNPALDSRIVREGPVEFPFKGWGRIIEHRVRGQAEVNFAWGLILYMGKEFMRIDIAQFTPYTTEAEKVWRKMIDSIRRVPDVKNR